MIDYDRLRSFAMALPSVTEGIQWEHDLLYRIGDKMFLVHSVDRQNGVGLKVTEEEFGELTMRPGITPSAYLARYHWVHISNEAKISHKELEGLTERSYRMVAAKLPKKRRKELGLE